MGTRFEDIQEEQSCSLPHGRTIYTPGSLRIKLGDKDFTPSGNFSFVLRQLKRNAERYFGAPSARRSFTVPDI